MNETWHENQVKPRQALLLAFQSPEHTTADVEESLDELEDLALSAGLEVVGRMVQARDRMDPGRVFGTGKVTEIKGLIGGLGADTAIFDGNLSPTQGRHLEKELKVLLLDRTQLILDIFTANARTREARCYTGWVPSYRRQRKPQTHAPQLCRTSLTGHQCRRLEEGPIGRG